MNKGPLAPLSGVPGLVGALIRAAVVAVVSTAGTVALAAGLATGIADVAAGRAPSSLGWAAAGVLVRAGAGWVGQVLAVRDARRGEDALRARVLARLLDGEGEAADAAGGTGPAAVLASTRLHELGPALATVVPAIAQVAVVPLTLLVVLGITDPLSALLVGITLPLVPLFMALVGMHTRDRTRAATRALDRIAEHVAELARGLPVLVGLGRAADQLTALRRLGDAHRARTLATLRVAFLSSLVLEILATLSVALVAVTVGVRLVEGGMSLQIGLLALLLAPEAFAPLRALGAAHHASTDAAEAVAASRQVLASPAARTVVTPGTDLSVTGLTVSFTGRTRPAVTGLDLIVRPGEVVALTGPSGCGKSTVLAVLAGTLRDGTRAEVTGSASVPGGVAFVPQHPRTTAPTVVEELAAHGARPEEIPELLAGVGADGLVDRACRSLSPGELARVALARALVRVHRGARVLLLDEPSASLDADSVGVVGRALERVRAGVSTVLVTHDPELAALADRTIELASTDQPAVVAPVASASAVPTVDTPGIDVPALDTPATDTPATVVGQRLAWPRRALGRAIAAGAASAAAGVALTATSGWLIVRAAEQPPILTLLVAIVAVRASGLARAGLRWLARLAEHDAALTLAAQARLRVWGALARQGLAADRTPGRALARVVGDVGLLQDLSVRVLTPIRVAAVVLGAAVAVLVVLDVGTGLVVGVMLAAAVLVMVLVHRRADHGPARLADTLRTTNLQETTTALDGATDLRAHGLATSVVDSLSRLGRDQGRAARRAAGADALAAAVAVATTGGAAVLALALAAAAVRTGTTSAPVAAVLALTPLALADPLLGLGGALRHRASFVDARSRIEEVLDEPVVADPVRPRALPRPVTSLIVRDLRVGWPGGPDVLEHVDADIDAGPGWLVVTGPSGSGKSTMLATLMTSLRPRAGRIELGGVDLTTVRGDDVRDAVAWCPQDAHVFAASIRGNLALAAPDADDARMRAVLARTGLGPLLATLPGGLDTPVGSGGAALSGGERRRLAVARALLADRDVVLLDEPTAHLDPPTAATLVADLRRALADRIVVCVTHDRTLATNDDTVLDLASPLLVPA